MERTRKSCAPLNRTLGSTEMKRGAFLLVFTLAHAVASGALAYGAWRVFEHRYGSNTALSMTDRAIQLGAEVLLSPMLPIAAQVPGSFSLPRVIQAAGLLLNSFLWAFVVWWFIPRSWKGGAAQQGGPGDAQKAARP